MSAVELEVLITLNQNKANISCGPHATFLAPGSVSAGYSQTNKKWKNKKKTKKKTTNGIQVYPQDETDVLAVALCELF